MTNHLPRLTRRQGVGRCGQAVLAVVSYAILTRVIRVIMAESPVNYRTFKAITLQHDSMACLGNLTKGLWVAHERRLKMTICWMIVAGVFVLFTPTWMSAMTGYTAAVSPMTETNNGAWIPAESFMPWAYMIYDGARLREDYSNETIIIAPWSRSWSNNDVVFSLDDYGNGCSTSDVASAGNRSDQRMEWQDNPTLDCKKMWAVSKYVWQYGLLGNNSTNTTFQMPDESDITTEVYLSPALNISAYFAVPSEGQFRHLFDSDEGDTSGSPAAGPLSKAPYNSSSPFDNPNIMFWDRGSKTTYNLTEFTQATRCQADAILEYHWGFSFLPLYVYLLAFLGWSLGMWSCCLYARSYTDPKLAKRGLGIERAVLDAAYAMEKTLDPVTVHLKGNAELKSLVETVQLSYKNLCDSGNTTRKLDVFSFKKWVRDEVWWLIALCFCTIMFGLGIAGQQSYHPVLLYLWVAWSPFFSSIPIVGILLVLTAGRDVSSRWVLAVPFFLLFLSLDIYWIYQLLIVYDDPHYVPSGFSGLYFGIQSYIY
jgi:hypothetical protein